jgi:hypothetical protein
MTTSVVAFLKEHGMATPQFDITIGKDGRVTVKVHGVSGAECVRLSDMVRDIVGREESRQLTSEYYGPGGQVRFQSQAQVRTKG